VTRVDIKAEFVMAAVQVLDRGMPCADYSGGAQPFQAAHRTTVGISDGRDLLRSVDQVLPFYVTSGWQQLVEYSRVGGCTVNGHLRRCEGSTPCWPHLTAPPGSAAATMPYYCWPARPGCACPN
jgi:hypothetical protein